MKEKKKKKIPSEDPSILSGEVIWQVEIFHTVFPVGTIHGLCGGGRG
jgi:hypothetical protein